MSHKLGFIILGWFNMCKGTNKCVHWQDLHDLQHWMILDQFASRVSTIQKSRTSGCFNSNYLAIISCEVSLRLFFATVGQTLKQPNTIPNLTSHKHYCALRPSFFHLSNPVAGIEGWFLGHCRSAVGWIGSVSSIDMDGKPTKRPGC